MRAPFKALSKRLSASFSPKLSFSAIASVMTEYHVPDLTKIQNLTDKEIRFYAIVGASISLSSRLQIKLTDIFQKALNGDKDLAAKILHQLDSIALQRNIVDAAMRHHLQSDATNLDKWKSLNSKIKKLSNRKNPRNLVAHTPISTTVKTGMAIGAVQPDGLSIGAVQAREEFQIVTDQLRILAREVPPREADFDSLLSHCEEAVQVVDEIDNFLSNLP